ncbi:MAG: hypothetical protein ACNYZG_03010 [Gammaproteobacteria bacterium]
MKSIKAIAAGSIFIIVVILFLQLAYIFIAVAYNAMAKDYPFLNDISGSFRYLIGIPVFVVTMFLGGYITANIANMKTSIKVWLHCIAVGLLTTGGMMYSALENTNITITGIVVFILALVATTAGGVYWQKNNRINQA